MNWLLALSVGILFAGSTYLLLSQNIFKTVIGLALLGHAANLLIFTVGGVTEMVPPIIPQGGTLISGVAADPLPQALILTAIVIGLGVQAFLIALISKLFRQTQASKTDASNLLQEASQP